MPITYFELLVSSEFPFQFQIADLARQTRHSGGKFPEASTSATGQKGCLSHVVGGDQKQRNDDNFRRM